MLVSDCSGIAVTGMGGWELQAPERMMVMQARLINTGKNCSGLFWIVILLLFDTIVLINTVQK